MRKSCALLTGLSLFFLTNISPVVAVNINNSSQNTKKLEAAAVLMRGDTVPVEDPYGLKMEPVRRRARMTARGGKPSSPSSYSNNYWDRELDQYYDFEEEKKTLVVKEPLIEVYNDNAQVKKIENDYSGFKVEIANSPTKLPETDVIFTQHGNIAEKERADGTFSYYLGDFDNEVDAYEFYNKILKEKYPLARVAKFEEGRRVW